MERIVRRPADWVPTEHCGIDIGHNKYAWSIYFHGDGDGFNFTGANRDAVIHFER